MEEEKKEEKKKCGCVCSLQKNVLCYLCMTLVGLVICILAACKVLPLWCLIIGICICAPQSFLLRRLDKDESVRAVSRDAGEKAGNATFKASVLLLACWSLCEYVAKAYSSATILLLAAAMLLTLYQIAYLLIKTGSAKKETKEDQKDTEKTEKA